MMSGPTRIEQLRRIVDERQYGIVDGREVDLFTATAILACYDSGNDRTKHTIATADLEKVADIALRTTR